MQMSAFSQRFRSAIPAREATGQLAIYSIFLPASSQRCLLTPEKLHNYWQTVSLLPVTHGARLQQQEALLTRAAVLRTQGACSKRRLTYSTSDSPDT